VVLASVQAIASTRIGPHTSYLTGVLPAVVVFAMGLAGVVAPLTATMLATADVRHAGVASGVNNAVARAASLLFVAAIPPLAGLTGNAQSHPLVSRATRRPGRAPGIRHVGDRLTPGADGSALGRLRLESGHTHTKAGLVGTAGSPPRGSQNHPQVLTNPRSANHSRQQQKPLAGDAAQVSWAP
jgi:hypothetical protein